MESSTIQKLQIPNTTKWLKTMYQNVQLAKKQNKTVKYQIYWKMQCRVLTYLDHARPCTQLPATYLKAQKDMAQC